MDKKNDDKKHIVVVGGGAGGAQSARAMSAKLDTSKYTLTLINPRPYYICLPTTPRMTVSDADGLEEKVLVPYDKLFHNGAGTFLQGKVAAIEKPTATGGHVVLENGERVPFDVLVLSPGSIWEGPIAFPEDKDEVTEFLKTIRASIKNAKDIVLAGGGAVGIGKSLTLFSPRTSAHANAV